MVDVFKPRADAAEVAFMSEEEGALGALGPEPDRI